MIKLLLSRISVGINCPVVMLLLLFLFFPIRTFIVFVFMYFFYGIIELLLGLRAEQMLDKLQSDNPSYLRKPSIPFYITLSLISLLGIVLFYFGKSAIPEWILIVLYAINAIIFDIKIYKDYRNIFKQ